MREPTPSRLVAGIISAAIALSACSSAATPQSEITTDAPNTGGLSEATAAEELADFIGDRDGGIDALIVRGGSTIRAAVGTADADGTPLTPGRPFRVGSVSKPFIATMTMQLTEEGSINLDEKLGTYLPGIPIGADATIRQLLSHQSGVPNYVAEPRYISDVLADPAATYTPFDVLAYVAFSKSTGEGRYAYSNTNYILLGLLIESIDGTDLNTSLATRITGPAQLTHTVFASPEVDDPQDLVGGWATGLMNGDPTQQYDALASSAWAAGSLISTTDDLARFMAALTSGELVQAESFAEMSETGEGGAGLGLFEIQLRPGQTGRGHGGSIFGYSATMAIDPESGDAVVVLTNNDQLVSDLVAPLLLQLS